MTIFTMEDIKTDDLFIQTLQAGVVTANLRIQICKITFDIDHYSDTLFRHFSIYYPEPLSTAVIKRKSEYLAARIAAKYLFGINNILGDVKSNIDRSPKWPLNCIGSISHSHQCAIVVIVSNLIETKRPIIGIDIEALSSKIDNDVSNSFTTLNERKLLQKIDIDLNTALLITFSAKESLFKALYPKINTYIGFDIAVITQLNTYEHNFILQLTCQLSDSFPIGYEFLGKYSIDDNYITTLIYEII